jgi:hypothetical protein
VPRSRKSLFYCVFFSPRKLAPSGTRFFITHLEQTRGYAQKRLRYHRTSEKAYIYSFESIPIKHDVNGLPHNKGFTVIAGKFYLAERVDELKLVEVIERTEDELIALVERRMSR